MAEIERLSRLTAGYYLAARAQTTRGSYSLTVRLFHSFLDDFNLNQYFLADDSNECKGTTMVICYYASYLAQRLAFGSIRCYLSGIRAYVLDNTLGKLDILASYVIKQVLKGIKRSIGFRPKPKHPISLQNIKDIWSRLDFSKLSNIRNFTSYIVAFFGWLRRSELITLKWEDIDLSDNRFIRIKVAYSKTDQFGQGVWVHIARRDDQFCVGKWLTRWLAASNNGSSWIFQKMSGSRITKDKWSTNGLVSAIKKDILLIGLNPKHYAGHSFRRGGATAAAAAGVPERLIQLHGRWKSDCYKMYIEEPVKNLLVITALMVI